VGPVHIHLSTGFHVSGFVFPVICSSPFHTSLQQIANNVVLEGIQFEYASEIAAIRVFGDDMIVRGDSNKISLTAAVADFWSPVQVVNSSEAEEVSELLQMEPTSGTVSSKQLLKLLS